MNPLVNCSVVAGTGLVTLLWLCLLIASLITRPKPSTNMRLLDRLLIIVSVLMIFATTATYLAIRAYMNNPSQNRPASAFRP
jgi:hypothetical protein